MIWCPYTDREIPIEETTPEHIISLALGGHNRLTLPVHGATNSKLGAEIDGALANEFHVARQRAKLDARGHSGREPTQRFTKVKDRTTGKPLQINWGKRLEVYDPIAQQPVNGPVDFELTTHIDMTIRMRFLAKCFLSAGYRVYGDLFRRAVRHEEPRLLMNRKAQDLTEAELASVRTRLFTWYNTDHADAAQAEEFEVQKQICSAIKGSLLVFMTGPENLAFFGGVLGQYLGMMNVPADTTDFPRTENYDMGFAIIVANGKLMTGSYRTLIRRLVESMPPEVRPAI